MNNIVEIFVDVYIDGLKTNYIVSDFGTVINIKTGKILKPIKFTTSDYWHVNLYINGEMKTVSLHRLVALHHIPNPENKPTVNHIIPGSKGKKINTVYNLEWATDEEQTAHRYVNDLIAYGARSGMCKLSDSDVVKICEMMMDNIPDKIIADIFNVTQTYISDLRNHKRRQRITKDYNFPSTKIRYNKIYDYSIKDQIKELIREGKKNSDIYKILGIEKNNKHRNMIDRIRKKESSSTTIKNTDSVYYIDIKV